MNTDPVKRRVNIKTAGTALIALLLILTFVSKTVYYHNLPVVTAVLPQNGKLDKTETVKGLAEWAEQAEAYAESGGYVNEIYVKEGERVVKGQALACLSLTQDEKSARRDTEYELRQAETDIRNAEEDCGNLKKLYEEGAVAKSEYEKEYRALQALYAKKEKLLLDNTDFTGTGALTVYAPDDGTVSEIPVHKGQKVGAGDVIAYCGLSGAFQIKCSVSQDNNFITEGDSCKLDNAAAALDGKVTEVKAEEGKKTVSVQIQSNEVKEGETFDVRFEKESAQSHIMVQNGALNRDGKGYFLYVVKQRDGMLGKEFYVDRLSVYVGDNDSENTIILKGVTFFEPVVLLSSKELEDGDTVILENEGDFFAE